MKKPISSVLGIPDGTRLTFPGGDIVHLIASGNASELRCYVAAENLDAAKTPCIAALGRVR
jgi:phosphomannomutase